MVMDSAVRSLAPGQFASLQSADGKTLAIAGVNRHALIAARVFSRNPDEQIDTAFVEGRLRAALEMREALYDRPFYRLVHAEADGLPGLIVDRFGDVVVAQFNAAVMEGLRPQILHALQAVVGPRAIVLRNDSPVRALEGLDTVVEIAFGRLDGPIPVEENGAHFLADPLGGQKTGWFFDQRDNRGFAASLARGRTVCDVYCHTGGFAVQAAVHGAARVTAIDRSAPALDLAAQAARLNGVSERVSFARAEAFEDLARRHVAGETFGLMIVDPPAFVKSKKSLKSGARGYRKLAKLATRLVEPGGFLLLASCSHHVDIDLLREQVNRGLADAGRTGRILRVAGAGPDHPIHPLLPESSYLKALVFRLD